MKVNPHFSLLRFFRCSNICFSWKTSYLAKVIPSSLGSSKKSLEICKHNLASSVGTVKPSSDRIDVVADLNTSKMFPLTLLLSLVLVPAMAMCHRRNTEIVYACGMQRVVTSCMAYCAKERCQIAKLPIPGFPGADPGGSLRSRDPPPEVYQRSQKNDVLV